MAAGSAKNAVVEPNDWQTVEANDWQDVSLPSAPPRPGFLKSLGASVGVTPDIATEMREHPVRSLIENFPPVAAARGIITGGRRSLGELLQGTESLKEGNPAEAGVHAIRSVPILGPALDKMSDQAPTPTPGESWFSQVKDAATDPGVMGTGLGAAAQAALLLLGGVDAAASDRPMLGRIPTKAHAAQILEDVREAVNRPRVETVRTPKGFLMPPEERIPLHEQPFRGGKPSQPVVLHQPDRPMPLQLEAPPNETPLQTNGMDENGRFTPQGVLQRPQEFPESGGMSHGQYIGEKPGTGGGRQPLQGVMFRRPPMSGSAPPPPRLFLDNQVRLSRSLPLLEKAQRLSEEGHGTISALDNLYRRINTINPLDYDEARSRNSALGTLTGEDKMRATPTLRRAAKQFNHAFGQDIGDTAERAGVGQKYRQGMKEYRRAARIGDVVEGLKSRAIPAAAGALGLAGATKLIRSLEGR